MGAGFTSSSGDRFSRPRPPEFLIRSLISRCPRYSIQPNFGGHPFSIADRYGDPLHDIFKWHVIASESENVHEKDLKDRTKTLALEVIRFSSRLPSSVEYQHIRRQLIRSAASAGANDRCTWGEAILTYFHIIYMLFHMRTTLIIPDPLMRQLKERAAQRGQTLSAVVAETLQRGLSLPRSQGRLTPLTTHRMGRPRVDVSDRDALYRAMEGSS